MSDAKDRIIAPRVDLFVTNDTQNWHLCSYSCPDVSNVQSRLRATALKYGRLTLHQCLSKCGFQTSSIDISWELVWNKFSGPIPVLLTQILWRWGPTIHVLTRLLDNSDVGFSLRAIAPCAQRIPVPWIPAPFKTMAFFSLNGGVYLPFWI